MYMNGVSMRRVKLFLVVLFSICISQGFAATNKPQELKKVKSNSAKLKQNVIQKVDEINTSRCIDVHDCRQDKHFSYNALPGSILVKDINTRFKLGGFAELDAIHDNDAINSKAQFITSEIVTRNATKAQGADGQTSFSVNPSLFYIETLTPLDLRSVKTFVSVDFFGDPLSSSPDPRLRQAYGKLTNALFGGDLMIGQAWSAFTDLEASPNTLDFQGPNSFMSIHEPMIRFTKQVDKRLKIKVEAESPNHHEITNADLLTRLPDGVLTLVLKGSRMVAMTSLIARDIKASRNNAPAKSSLGWGLVLSGKLGVPFGGEKDSSSFEVTYGEGIGTDFNDAPPDAVIGVINGKLKTIPMFGVMLSYEHWWDSNFSSTASYGYLSADNVEEQAGSAFKRTQYASANFVWHPNHHLIMGIEGLWGGRKDKDGKCGSDFRSQFTSKFTF